MVHVTATATLSVAGSSPATVLPLRSLPQQGTGCTARRRRHRLLPRSSVHGRFCQTEALKTEPTIEQDVDDDDEDRTYVRPVVVIVTASDQQKKEKTVRTHAHSLTLLPARSSSRPPAGSRWKIKSNPTRRSNGSPEATETPAMFSPRTYVFGADLVSQSFNQLF